MPSLKLSFILAAFGNANLADLFSGPSLDAATFEASDPQKLLAAYAVVTCSACVILRLWQGRGTQSVAFDGIRLVGLLSLAFSPFCFLTTGNAMAGVAMAASGILGFGCASVIKGEENRRRQEKLPRPRSDKTS